MPNLTEQNIHDLIPLRPETKGLHWGNESLWRRRYRDAFDCDRETATWLRRKTDRTRRLVEALRYCHDYLRDVMASEPGHVYDFGPGPGEFLEIWRHLGHTVEGVDAKTGDGGMGDRYLAVSRLMTERQEIPVAYCGLTEWLAELDKDNPECMRGTASLINSRGSIEQCFADCMIGLPHHLHHDCKRLKWCSTASTRDALGRFFRVCHRLLRPGGVLLIHANGSADNLLYCRLVTDAAGRAGLVLDRSDGTRLHRWHKES